jgi:hypothetical protein
MGFFGVNLFHKSNSLKSFGFFVFIHNVLNHLRGLLGSEVGSNWQFSLVFLESPCLFVIPHLTFDMTSKLSQFSLLVFLFVGHHAVLVLDVVGVLSYVELVEPLFAFNVFLISAFSVFDCS